MNTINCFICIEIQKKLWSFQYYKQNNSKYMYSTKTENCTTFGLCRRGWWECEQSWRPWQPYWAGRQEDSGHSTRRQNKRIEWQSQQHWGKPKSDQKQYTSAPAVHSTWQSTNHTEKSMIGKDRSRGKKFELKSSFLLMRILGLAAGAVVICVCSSAESCLGGPACSWAMWTGSGAAWRRSAALVTVWSVALCGMDQFELEKMRWAPRSQPSKGPVCATLLSSPQTPTQHYSHNSVFALLKPKVEL